VAQDIAEATWSHVHLTMQILRLRCPPGESLVETLHKSRQEVISGIARTVISLYREEEDYRGAPADMVATIPQGYVSGAPWKTVPSNFTAFYHVHHGCRREHFRR
jgi:hypothetical protein